MSLQNIAQHVAQQGRGNDKMLVHMSPQEVGALQKLAQQHGLPHLTTNPNTGLPEAGFLDSILPTVLGAGISYLTDGAVSPAMLGLGVGAASAVASGSIQKGLMAGLGAYGGAGLEAGLAGAGAANLGTDALTAAQSSAADLINQGVITPDMTDAYVQQQVGDKMASATPLDKLSAGISGLSSEAGRSSALNAIGGTKGAVTTGLAALAPMMTMSQPTVSMPGTNASPTAYVQTKMVNPYTKQLYDVSKVPASQFTGTYQDQINNADLSRYLGKAAGGGLMGLAHGGMVKHYDDGGSASDPNINATYTPQQISDYIAQNNLSGDALTAAENQFGVTQQQVNYANALNSPLAASDPFAATVASADTANNIPVSVGVQNEAATGSPYTNYSDQQMAQYIQQQGINTSDPAALAAAEQATNADPAAVQAFLASGADPYSAQSLANPAQSNVSSFDAQLGTKGATTDINNAVYAAQLAAGVPGGTSNSITANTQIANEMDNWNVDPASMANAVGMTPEAIQALYNQVDPNGKFSTLPKTQVINTPGNSGGGGGGGGGTGPVTNVTTSTPINTAPASTLKPGVSGNTGPAVTGGGTVVNANGTITESPVLPGIPQGGFTGMQNLLDTYTKGGGSTGYVSPTVSSMDEFNSKYNTLSGGTKAAYNYLMGQGNYPIAPSSSTGQVMKPYSESVLGIPQSATIPDTQKYYVDSTTHMLTLNPKYNPASTNSGSGVGNTASTSGATGNSLVGTSINVNGGKAVYDPVSGYYLINGQYYNADGTPSGYNPSSGATGGLMGMAHGGHIKRYAGNAGSLVNNASEAYENSNLNEEGEYQNDPLEAFYKTVPSSVMRTPAGAGLAAALYSPTLNRGEQDQLDMIRQQMHSPTSQYAGGRMRHTMSNMAHGGMADDSYNLGGYSDGGRLLRGPGDGVSDDIPATIGHKQPARLADGEFVVPARIVSELGNGSTEAGAKQLYAMMDRVQKARGKTVGKNKVATNTKAAKYLPA